MKIHLADEQKYHSASVFTFVNDDFLKKNAEVFENITKYQSDRHH